MFLTKIEYIQPKRMLTMFLIQLIGNKQKKIKKKCDYKDLKKSKDISFEITLIQTKTYNNIR